MKNFKKVLALVLAVATLLSFATVASAATADYKDAKDVKNTEAVDILSTIGVLNGYTDGEYKPNRVITRAEAAKIIAMFDNGDTDIKELYAPVNFTDVASNHWAQSYISYCYHTGIIAGVGNNKYAPEQEVTGVQFLKMVLVVLGFDAKEEGLVGTGYSVRVRNLARELGLLDGIGNNFDYTAGLTRDNAAQIMLNALMTETVEYGKTISVNGVGSSLKDVSVLIADSKAVFTGEMLAKEWNLYVEPTLDPFGRPGHEWYWFNADYPNTNKPSYELIAAYTDTPVAVYNTAVAGCDIYNDTGLKGEFIAFEDGVPGDETVLDKASDMHGAQGQITEVYALRGEFNKLNNQIIVHINTYLATVSAVSAEKKDSKGHVTAAATISFDNSIYARTGNDNYRTGDAGKYLTAVASVAATGFSAGEKVLVQGVIDIDQGENNYGCPYIEVINVESAKSEVAKLTGVDNTKTVGYLSVGGTKTPVACKYAWEADRSTADCWKSMTFYYDSFGNVIGTTPYDAPAQYAVLDKMYIEYAKGDSAVYAVMVLPNGDKVDITVADVIYEGVKFAASDYIARIDDGQIVDNNWEVQWAGSNYYKNYYYGKVIDYVKNEDGTYNLNIPGRAVNVSDVIIAKGSKYIFDATNTKKPVMDVTADTVFLYQTAGAPNASYASYTGYENVPTITAASSIQVIKSGTTATFVYVLLPVEATTSKTVVWNGAAPSAELIAGTDVLLYTYSVQVVGEDGKLTADTVTSLKDFDELFTDGNGVYTLTLNKSGVVTAATRVTGTAGTVKLTATGIEKVYNYGSGSILDLRTVAFVNLTTDGKTAADLDDCYVALVKDASGNVVAAYYNGVVE